MTTETITFRVDASERADIAARAARDKVSVSDYIRVRLGLRGEGPQQGDAVVMSTADDAGIRARLADHDRRLDALEADRAAVA
jgi:mobilization protein NikA